jgi:glycosyltransferase involved in cell wall biosynthesis
MKSLQVTPLVIFFDANPNFPSPYLDEHGNNLGLGGSEHYLLKLAQLASKNEIPTLIYGSDNFDSGLEGVAGISSTSELPEHFVTIVNSGSLSSFKRASWPDSRLIVLSHHPHDGHLRSWQEMSGVTIVNLGKYQWLSNGPASNVRLIPGFSPDAISSKRHLPKEGPLVVGHVSSLHPSKGFHDVLKIWTRLARSSNRFRFEVVGGPALYSAHAGEASSSQSRYLSRLTKMVKKGGLESKIRFHGVLRDHRTVSDAWHAATQNPRGIAEADPVSLKEFFAAGIPVFASKHFGMGDYMRELAKLSLSSGGEPVKKFLAILFNPDSYSEASLNVLNLAQRLKERNVLAERGWIELIRRGELNSRWESHEVMPFYQSKSDSHLSIKAAAVYFSLFRILERCLQKVRSLRS